jgi:hypothetical protein
MTAIIRSVIMLSYHTVLLHSILNMDIKQKFQLETITVKHPPIHSLIVEKQIHMAQSPKHLSSQKCKLLKHVYQRIRVRQCVVPGLKGQGLSVGLTIHPRNICCQKTAKETTGDAKTHTGLRHQ